MPVNVIMIMAEIGNQVGNEPWPSLETASWLFDRASFVLIGSLVFGAVATVVIVWTGIVKEHHWDLLREAAGEKIAELTLETSRANADAAKANENAANARERTAELNLALEMERQKRAPRHLKSEQLDTLVAALANIGERLSIVGRDEDEPRQYADQFIAAMRTANLLDENTPYRLTNSPSNNWTGIRLYIPSAKTQDDVENDLLTKAFKKAQIPVVGLSWGFVSGVVVDPKLNLPRRTIYVGQKPLEN
jgi:hypothetical protein